MSILVNEKTRVLIQGFTGREGTFHAQQMMEYGTSVVGGVTPGKGGAKHLERPVFNTVAEGVKATGADASVIFVPPPYSADAILEAVDAQLPLVVCITEGIPALDMVRVAEVLKGSKTRLIGPNCPGIASPGKSNAGIIPADITSQGRIGLVSKSGTLTYQMMYELRDIGFSTAVGIGGDPIIGTTHIDALAAFEADPETKAIVMIGEIGGDAEERAAAFIAESVTKPVAAYIAGVTAPPGRKMGHAGAIISGSAGTAQAKMEALAAAGVQVAQNPTEWSEFLAHVKSAGTAPSEISDHLEGDGDDPVAVATSIDSDLSTAGVSARPLHSVAKNDVVVLLPDPAPAAQVRRADQRLQRRRQVHGRRDGRRLDYRLFCTLR